MSEEEKPEIRIQLSSGDYEIKTITLSSSINTYILTIFALQFTSVMTALGAEVTTVRAPPIKTTQYGYFVELNSARTATTYLLFIYIWTFGFVMIFSLLGFIKHSRSFFRFLIFLDVLYFIAFGVTSLLLLFMHQLLVNIREFDCNYYKCGYLIAWGFSLSTTVFIALRLAYFARYGLPKKEQEFKISNYVLLTRNALSKFKNRLNSSKQ